jgi:hypothetical protein
MPTDTEMKREGMLYRYLRDYTPSSPMQSPLEGPSHYDDPEEDDSTNWWTTDSHVPIRRDSSPSVDAMDTSSHSNIPTPITIPSPRRGSVAGDMSVSPMNIMPPPPILPHVQRMKRKGISSRSLFPSQGISVDCSNGGLRNGRC